MFFDVLLCKKECESIIETHVGIANSPLIKNVFDFIILIIFSVFFLARFCMPKQVRVKIVVILWAIYIAGDWAGIFSHKFYKTNRKAFLPVCCYPEGIKLSFCTLCFCLPTKMLYLNAPFFH